MHNGYALTIERLFTTMTSKLNFKKDTSTTQKEQYSLQLDAEHGIMKSRREEGKIRRKTDNSWYYMGLVGQIGYAIALPIAGGGLLGGYIDKRLSTYPKATLLLLFIGFVISIAGFIQTIRELMRQK